MCRVKFRLGGQNLEELDKWFGVTYKEDKEAVAWNVYAY